MTDSVNGGGARICLSVSAYPPILGGVGVASQRLARTLIAAGYRVHVVTPCDGDPGSTGSVQRSEGEDGVVVHRLTHDFRNPQAGFDYRQLVRDLDDENEFDLFHGFFLTAAYPCIATAARHGRRRPVIVSIRGNDAARLIDMPYTRRAILSSLRKATWVTSVNQVYLGRVAEEVDITGRSSVIRNGIRPLAVDEKPWQLGSANRGVVGTVGQFRQVKDIPLLVRGYNNVRSDLRRRLLLAGYFSDADHGEESWSEILWNEFGIAEQVEVTGPFAHEEVFRYLRGMHVYVQSSAYEGLPNALLEAASLGVPLVATAVGGMREVLEDGKSALMTPHGDPVRLGAAIERILSNEALALTLSRGARELAAELSQERERGEWLALYEQLLEDSSP